MKHESNRESLCFVKAEGKGVGLALGLAAALIGIVAVPVAADRPEPTAKPTALAVSVPTPPRWMRGVDGMLHVDYDLLITNWLRHSTR